MKVIISPAKKMKIKDVYPAPSALPCFIDKTRELMYWIQGLSYEEAKKLWVCNDKLAKENFDRFMSMDLENNLSPAILSYDGIQYTYMAPDVFEASEFKYIQENLRILSGFYGVLRPMDGVTPYRLEMQAKVKIGNHKSLYAFWGNLLYEEVLDDSKIIINLASKEYSKCIEAYLSDKDRFITCLFGSLDNGKVIQKGVYAKMARGEMVRYMAVQDIHDPEDLKAFNYSGYSFCQERSTDNEYVFLREGESQ